MIPRSSPYQISLSLNIPHSETMETRGSLKAIDKETSSPPKSPSQDPPQIVPGPFSTPKIKRKADPLQSEKWKFVLSDEVMNAVIAMRNPPSTMSYSLPSRSSTYEDFKTDLEVSYTKLEQPLPPIPNPPTAVTAPSTSTALVTEKIPARKTVN